MRNSRAALMALLWGLALLTGCASAPPVAPTPPPTPTPPSALMGDAPVEQRFASPAYGIHTFMWWKPELFARDLALVKDMGFGWAKQKFAWREIEGIRKGHYDWYRPDLIVEAAEAAGIELLVRLDRQPFWADPPDNPYQENQPPGNLQDFGDFCGAVAARYRGRIAAYQVWNEPNLSREWGERPPDPAAYTALLQVCYTAIKAADPDAIVISAGLAPTGTSSPQAMPDVDFLWGMYAAGAADYYDVLGLNAPGYKAPPELPPEEALQPEYGGGRWFAFRHVEEMRAIMVANGDGHKQVAILEMGWTLDQVNPEYAWFAVDEQTQADYLVRAYRYAVEHWRPWIGLMTAVYIADYDWTPEEHEQWWWAIVLPDGTPRPAYYALQAMEK
jgi:polysaccharide biosynthesis protein PslG